MFTPDSLPDGTVIAGKLRVVRTLGMGGMGAVYEVEHEFTKHHRALKLLHAEMLEHPIVVARFLREASAAGRIGNAHIVETFDAGTLESGEPYIVMEMLEGETLASRLERQRKIPLGDLAEIVRQACDGVQAAHAAGIVHRDLKPENLFLVERDGKAFVKILDFGISKFDAALTGTAAHGTTKEGSALGTPYYMSPEQVNGEKDIDSRTDIYALGVILYECSSGTRPFIADALPKLSVLIHEGRPTPLVDAQPDLPVAFAELVHRAMAKDRNDRFSTARELGEALAGFGEVALDVTIPETTAARMSLQSRPPAAIARSERPFPLSVAPKPSGPTMGGATRSLAVEPGPRQPSAGNRPLLVVGALALLAGGVGAVSVFASSGSRHAGGPAVLTAPPPPQQVTADTPPPAPPSSVTVVLSPTASAPPPALAPTTPPSATARAAGSIAGAATARPGPSASAAPASSRGTRVDQRGLASDNPFK